MLKYRKPVIKVEHICNICTMLLMVYKLMQSYCFSVRPHLRPPILLNLHIMCSCRSIHIIHHQNRENNEISYGAHEKMNMPFASRL